VGIRITQGWRGKVREVMGGTKGCTHLTELLATVATTAFQTLVSMNGPADEEHPHTEYVPYLINSCHTHAEDSPVVEQNWPEFYQGKQP